MKAIVLSAGQGRRLLPLTSDRPKCLLPVAGRSLLEWQTLALAASGFRDIVVVTGFASAAVEEAVDGLSKGLAHVRTVFNPFFAVAENIGSCYVVRHEMEGDFILLNGDTLIEPAILSALLADEGASVTVAVDRKPRYDADDMKVSLAGRRMTAIGKTLPLDTVGAESIGLIRFRRDGGRLFTDGLEAVLREPQGLRRYYLSVIDRLAKTSRVDTVDIAGKQWSEIDFPEDLARAEHMVAGWMARGWARTGRGIRASG